MLHPALELLNLLNNSEEKIEAFQLYQDTKTEKLFPKIIISNFNTAFSEIEEYNNKGFSVCYSVNETDGKGRKAANVVKVRALFVDLDGASLEPVYKFKLEPSIIIESSPRRFHVYWVVDNFPLPLFKTTQQRLAEKFNGDKACNDLSRVLRLPGFINNKYDKPFKVKVIESNHNRYTKEQFAKVLGDVSPPQFAKVEQKLETDFEDLKAALEYLPADDYLEWLETGMSIHSAFPDSKGFDLWDEWSFKSDNYNSKDFNLKKWQSFNSSGRTVLSIFKLAAQNGYVKIPEPPKDFKVVFNKDKVKTKKNKSTLILPDELALSAPGLLGEVTRWITDNAIVPQPALALATTIAWLGAVKGHFVETETGLRTNFCVCGIARSGHGKKFPMTAVNKIIQEIAGPQNGFQDPKKINPILNIRGGEPTSGAAIHSALIENRGKRYLEWDEIGHSLQQIANKNAGNFQREIINTIMKISTSANELYIGKQYANLDKKRETPAAIINQPHLCIYGATTPKVFYSCITEQSVADGFLARWLFIEGNPHEIEERSYLNLKVPRSIKNGIAHYYNYYEDLRANQVVEFSPEPKTVPYSTDARAYRDEIKDKYRARAYSEFKENSGFDAILQRGKEHTEKLALLATDSSEISLEAVKWADQVVTCSINGIIEAVKDYSFESGYQKNLKLIKRVIDESGQLSKTDLYKLLIWRGITRRERDECLAALVESSQIIEKKVKVEGSRKSRSIYCSNIL